MQNRLLKLYVTGQMFWNKFKEHDGVGLMEYAGIVSLVALGIAASVSSVASGLNTALTAIGTKLQIFGPVSTISGR